MKNFKIKIMAVIICICMCFSVLTGCSLFVKNTEKDNAKVALKIGDTVITKEELVEDYNRFYQQNSSYFMYYDTDTIMDIFYNSVVSNKIIMIEAGKLVDDGTLIITDKDVQGVWDKVFDFVYDQVDSKEKVILSLAGKEEKDYPARLQEEESSDEKAYKYEEYKFEPVEVKTENEASFDEENFKIDDEIDALKAYVLKYNAGDDENKNMVDIAEDELTVRKQAYNEVIADLQFVAKTNKKDSKAESVLKAEVERVYKSYYESMLYTKYQEYINSTTAGVEGKYENQYSDSAIAEKYKKLLNASKEANTVESSYVELVTSSSTDTLILYHNEDTTDLYFTVQHILVKFDDETLDTLKETAGYDVTKDAMFREYYEGVRSSIATDEFIKAMETSYRDAEGLTVKEDDGTGNKVESKIAIGTSTDTEGTILGEYNKELVARIGALQSSEEYIAMTATEKVVAEQRAKTLLFQEFSWKYSEDTGSLVSDKLSGVLGFTINNKANENGSWVKEFAEGARELLKDADNHDGTYNLGAKIVPVVSDYGVHLMMLTGVYGKGEVVGLTKDTVDGIVDKTDSEIVADLKNTYISNLTTESLYEYVYDLVKNELIGDNGTYFTDHRNALVKEYTDANKIKYVNKMSNTELTNAISG